jgi:hypothetical protein
MLDAEGRYLSVNRAWEDFMGRRRQDVIGQAARASCRWARRRGTTSSTASCSNPAGPPLRIAHHPSRRLAARPADQQGGRARATTARRRASCRPSWTSASCAAPNAPPARRATPPRRPRVPRASSSPTSATSCARRCSRSSASRNSAWCVGASSRGWRRCSPTSTLSGRRMLALVNDLLDVSKLESTVGTFHLERTDLRPLVREVAARARPAARP